MTQTPKSASDYYTFQNAVFIVLALTLYRAFMLYGSGFDLYADEAYYWGWAQSFEFGYYSKPPMVGWLIIASTALLGESEFAIKAGSLFLYFFTPLVLYALGRELYDKTAAFFIAVAFATVPAVSLSSMVISTDAPFLFFWALSLLFFVKAIRTDRAPFWMLAGVSAGLGLLSKYTMILFLVSAVAYLFGSERYRRHLRNPHFYMTMALAALIYLPNLLWNVDNGFASFLHTRDNAGLEGSLIHPGRMFEFLGAQFGVFGPVLFAVLLYLLAGYPRRRGNETYRMLWWFIMPFLGLITVLSLLSSANANWAAPVYVAATVLVVGHLATAQRMRLLGWAIGINLALGLVFYNFYALTGALGIELKASQDPYKRVRGWHELGERVEAQLKRHPGDELMGEHRRTLAELIYYVRPHPFDAQFWNPDGSILNHYELTTDLTRHLGEDFIFITSREQIDDVRRSFERVTLLERIEIPLYPDYALRYDLYRLEGFKGYR